MPSARQLQEASSLNLSRLWDPVVSDLTDDDLRGYSQIYPSGFRPTRQATDVPETLGKSAREVGLWLYQSNPIAHRYVEQTKDFVVGSGVSVEAESDRVQRLIDEFWHHPDNHMDTLLPMLVTDLSIYGEILLTLAVDGSGLLKTAYVSSGNIEEVKLDSTDLSRPKEVVLLESYVQRGSPNVPLVRVNPGTGFREGEGLFLAINKAADASRGLSDLFPMNDVIGNLDSFIFNVVERARHMLHWFWDVRYEGATDQQLRAYNQQIQREGTWPGAVRLHNEKVAWTSRAPELGGGDMQKVFEALFTYVVTGLGIPPHWTGSAEFGRTASEASQEPAYRRLISRQTLVKRYLRELIAFQLDERYRRGQIPKNVSSAFDLKFPVIMPRDLQRLGGAASRISQAIMDGVEKDIYTKEEARAKIDDLLSQAMRQSS